MQIETYHLVQESSFLLSTLLSVCDVGDGHHSESVRANHNDNMQTIIIKDLTHQDNGLFLDIPDYWTLNSASYSCIRAIDFKNIKIQTNFYCGNACQSWKVVKGLQYFAIIKAVAMNY